MLAKTIVEIAQREVGTREVGGNNLGPRVVEYQKATWLKPGAWPWCAAFCCWVLREALIATGHRLGDRCLDASAFGWERWARTVGWKVITKGERAKAGDFVIFDFNGPADGGGHIGIVEFDQKVEGIIDTIEGNTNGRGDRDSVSGDGVWRKTRGTAMVRCYLRPIN